jgi:hypothetical protein
VCRDDWEEKKQHYHDLAQVCLYTGQVHTAGDGGGENNNGYEVQGPHGVGNVNVHI